MMFYVQVQAGISLYTRAAARHVTCGLPGRYRVAGSGIGDGQAVTQRLIVNTLIGDWRHGRQEFSTQGCS
jgi:hypothetical protein